MKVVNIKHNNTGHYIGRPGRGKKGSALANPFILGKDGNRDEVCEKYRKWLWTQIQSGNRAVLDELDFIRKNRPNLVCFCAPQRCHGDTIVKCIEWMERTGFSK